MSEKLIIASTLLFACKFSFAQYKGGGNDGFANAIFNKLNTTDANAFKGGGNDGFANAVFGKLNATDPNAFKGNSNDGFANAAYSRRNSTDSTAFKGGSNDGFTTAVFGRQNSTYNAAFRGGSKDGFAVSVYTRQVLTDTVVFRGGIGRGETQVLMQRGICGQPGASAVWNGSVSNAWSNPNNWDCGNVPTVSSVVVIPSGLVRYPNVFVSAEIKSLQLQPGSSVTVPPGIHLKVNGQ